LTRSKAVTELKWKRHGGDNYYKTSSNQPGLPVVTQRWQQGGKWWQSAVSLLQQRYGIVTAVAVLRDIANE